jgi:hypothetical protein
VHVVGHDTIHTPSSRMVNGPRPGAFKEEAWRSDIAARRAD